MSVEINYSDVLADLRTKQAAIEQAINGITALMNLGTISGGSAGSNSPAEAVSSGEIAMDAFFGLSIVEASKKYLSMMKRPKTTQEIATALVAGGYNHTSKSFYSTIFSVLSRESNKSNGDIVKVNERWGLAEWYPNRPRNVKRAASTRDAVMDDVEDEPASEERPTQEAPIILISG